MVSTRCGAVARVAVLLPAAVLSGTGTRPRAARDLRRYYARRAAGRVLLAPGTATSRVPAGDNRRGAIRTCRTALPTSRAASSPESGDGALTARSSLRGRLPSGHSGPASGARSSALPTRRRGPWSNYRHRSGPPERAVGCRSTAGPRPVGRSRARRGCRRDSKPTSAVIKAAAARQVRLGTSVGERFRVPAARSPMFSSHRACRVATLLEQPQRSGHRGGS